MNYKKLTLPLFLLVLISSQAHGMMISNIRKQERILNKSNLIDTLPKEIIENIFITYILNQESQQVNAIPCVSNMWNEIANSPFFIKHLVQNFPYLNQSLTQWLKFNGFKKYVNINQQLFDACYKNKPLSETEQILMNSYVNINQSALDNLTPLCIAAQNDNLELMQLLLNNKADINADHVLFYALSNSSEDKIESFIKTFVFLCNSGAKDNGTALNQIMRLSRCKPTYYQTISLFKNTDTNSNRRGNYGETSLHILLDPNYDSIPDKETLIILMRDYNANPHIKNVWNNTTYNYAKELETKYNDSGYLEIIQKYDKGIEWYEKNPRGCYTGIS